MKCNQTRRNIFLFRKLAFPENMYFPKKVLQQPNTALITKSSPKTVAKLLHKAYKYMNIEYAVIAKKVMAKRKRDEGTSHNPDRRKEIGGIGHVLDKKKNLPDQRPKFTSFTPLVMPIELVLMQIKDEPSL